MEPSHAAARAPADPAADAPAVWVSGRHGCGRLLGLWPCCCKDSATGDGHAVDLALLLLLLQQLNTPGHLGIRLDCGSMAAVVSTALLKQARNYVYAGLLRHGRAPAWNQIMRHFELDRCGVARLFGALEAAHDVVMLPNKIGGSSTSYILMSHPFSNIPTPHFAELDAHAVGEALQRLERDALLHHATPAVVVGEDGQIERYGN
eukprot:SAG31_NODE_828_length_11716_cov_4.405785_4_plen_205_part_00